MKFVYIPELDQKVSRVALGVNKTGNKHNSKHSEQKNRIRFYHDAMSLGVNLFDTAELYGGGHSEEILGNAISGVRQDVLVCSKFNARNSEQTKLERSLESSLRRLKTDYIDFYLAYWPNPNVPIEDLICSLDKFKKQGKIRAYGLSNPVYKEVCDFKIKNNNNFFIVENEYNLIEREVETEILPFCKKNNFLFMAYSPLLQGKKVALSEKIIALEKKYACTIQQIMLYWIGRKNVVSIVRTLNHVHLHDNIKSLDINMSEEDMKIVENFFGVKKSLIKISEIKIDNRSYMSLNDAIGNKNDLIPSPALLAGRIKNKYSLPPLRVVKRGSKYEILDDYYFSEIKKYWASKICNETEIEAYVFSDL